MSPVVAPVGTVAVMLVAVLEMTVAVVPLNFTVLLAGVELKFVPLIVTEAPTAAEDGENELMDGTIVAI